jgi:hypothetical protein
LKERGTRGNWQAKCTEHWFTFGEVDGTPDKAIAVKIKAVDAAISLLQNAGKVSSALTGNLEADEAYHQF